jgi:hypothetical protein
MQVKSENFGVSTLNKGKLGANLKPEITRLFKTTRAN